MYTFSNKLRNIAIVLMVLGLIGIVYGFLSAPKTIEDVEKIVAASHHGGHGEGHAATPAQHEAAAAVSSPEVHKEEVAGHQEAATHEGTAAEGVAPQGAHAADSTAHDTTPMNHWSPTVAGMIMLKKSI